tara:strand:- start:73 stop:387 length:315 start_codon:yes stop_codon:yes gene_type:complete
MTDVNMFDEARQADQIKKLKRKLREAEGDLSIIKGIGNNSPEMKALKARVKELMEINREHKMINGKLHSELEIEKKNNALLREDLQAKDLEIGRMMKKISNKNS